MICKCPKCGCYTNSQTLDFQTRLKIASSKGSQSLEQTIKKGGEVADQLGQMSEKIVGKTISMPVKALSGTAVSMLSTAYGQLNYLTETASSMLNPSDSVCFCCSNNQCKHEWVMKIDEAEDLSEEYYSDCLNRFYQSHGRRYIVVNHSAATASTLEDNMFILRSVPDNIIVPENHIREGSIYISHPTVPEQFFPLESYRLSLLKDELDDLSIFLTKLGAKTITMSAESTITRSNSLNTKKSSGTKAENSTAEVSCEMYFERELEEYNKIIDNITEEIENSIPKEIEVDAIRFGKWQTIRPQWRKIKELREKGTLKYVYHVSTDEMTSSRKSELDRICASFSSIQGDVDQSYVRDTVSAIKEAKVLKIRVEVTFYPLQQIETSNTTVIDNDISNHSNSVLGKIKKLFN